MNRTIRGFLLAFAILLSIHPYAMRDPSGSASHPFTRINDMDMESTGASKATSHSVIIIDGNSDLLSTASAEGWNGTGSPSDPVVIEELEIDAGSASNCIYIGNTTLDLIILNSTLTNASYRSIPFGKGAGITLFNVSNVMIAGCDTTGNADGVYIRDSREIQVKGNNLSGNFGHGLLAAYSEEIRVAENVCVGNDFGMYIVGSDHCSLLGNNCSLNDDHGIRLDDSRDNLIEGNTAFHNDDGVNLDLGSINNRVVGNRIEKMVEYGIYVGESYGNTFHENRMRECGFLLFGGLDTFTGQLISRNNTVNGRPVYQYNGGHHDNATVPPDAAQVIVGNSSYLTISDLNLNRTTCGLMVGYSSSILVSHNDLSENDYYGILAVEVSGSVIHDNTIFNDEMGIYLIQSGGNSISSNDIKGCQRGLYLVHSTGNSLNGNRISGNGYGIHLTEGSSRNQIGNNTISRQNWSGIKVESANNDLNNNTCIDSDMGIDIFESPGCGIHNNSCRDNEVGISLRSVSRGCKITSNECIGNRGDGILLRGSIGLTICDNHCSQNGAAGINLEHSLENSLSGNHISDNSRMGIHLYRSRDNIFHENEMVNCSVHLDGDVKTFTSQDIPRNNTVNGKPILYYKNLDYQTMHVSGEAGEVICGCIQNLVLKGFDIGSGSVGILIGYSNNITVVDSHICGNGMGIHLIGSDTITIGRCNISHNTREGLLLVGSVQTTVTGNDLTYNGKGVRLYGSEENRFYLNVISGSQDDGMELSSDSSRNVIRDNLIRGNGGFGLSCKGCYLNWIYSNAFIGNRQIGRESGNISQVFDDTRNNIWSPSELDTGNYWSDLRIPDADGDGIVDHPYWLDDGEPIDVMPLVYLPESILPPPPPEEIRWGNGFTSLWWNATTTLDGLGASAYLIYRRVPPDQPAIIGSVSGYELTYNDTSVINDREYLFSIRVQCIYGSSLLGEEGAALPDGTPPTLEIIYPGNGSTLGIDTFMIEWDGKDELGAVEFLTSMDGEEFVRRGEEKRALYRGLSEGKHLFRLRAVDPAGNSNERTIHFTIDTVDPVLTILDPLDGSIINDSALVLSWTANGTGSDISTFLMRIDGGNWRDIGICYSHDAPSLMDGEHDIRLKAVDMAGNEGGDEISFSLDRVPPEVLDYGPVGADAPLDTYVFVTFSEGMSRVGSQILAEGIRGEVDWRENTMILWPEGPLTSGESYSIAVEATDIAGNPIVPLTWTFSTAKDDGVDMAVIIGSVVDEMGHSLVGVLITTDSGENTTTDDEGEFKFSVLPGEIELTFNKPGFSTLVIDLVVEAEEERELGIITLHREEPADENGDENTDWILFAAAGTIILLAAASGAYYLFLRGRSGAYNGRSEE